MLYLTRHHNGRGMRQFPSTDATRDVNLTIGPIRRKFLDQPQHFARIDRHPGSFPPMEKPFRFSNSHSDYQARDAKSVFGWRYSPRIMLKSGKGAKLFDMDDNAYY